MKNSIQTKKQKNKKKIEGIIKLEKKTKTKKKK
jgi:hypothetical protein